MTPCAAASTVGEIANGEVELDVEVLRRKRSMSHVRAHVRNVGAANGHITTAVLGAMGEGFEFSELQPNPFWASRVEGRAAMGVAPWEAVDQRSAEQVTWYRFDDTPWIDGGARVGPFAIVLLADTMPGAICQEVGPTERPWFCPSVDLTVHMCADCRSPWLLAHNTARWAGDGTRRFCRSFTFLAN